jgi:hypothetical protein
MALNVALSDLRARAILRADAVGSPFRTLTLGGEFDALINANYRKAYRLLSQADDEFNISSEDYTTTTSEVYALPATFWREKKVEGWPSGTASGPAIKLRKFRLDEIQSYSWTGTGPAGFRLRGSNLILYPTPSAGILVRLWYTPAPSLLTSDANTIDAVCGIDELIVIGTARDYLVEEGDPEQVAMLSQLYEMEQQRILSDMQGRAEPEQAADVLGSWYE